MTPEEVAFAAIRNQIRLENLGRDVARRLTPQLREIFKEISRQIASLPEEAILREIRYRQMQLSIASLLRQTNDQAYGEIVRALSAEVERQVEFAAKTIDQPVPTVGISTTTGAPIGQITPTQLTAVVQDTKVAGARLAKLFGMDGSGTSVYIQSNIKTIDRVVKTGFLTGQTNEQIAQAMAAASNVATRQTRAIARTAVMDMSQRAHDQFYAANREFIELYRFDATFDYRVCPECAPLDGQESKNRSDIPSPPIHPNCRCRVLAITATQLELEREDLKGRQELNMTEIAKTREQASGRIYKTPARIGGEKYTKFAREVELPVGQRPTMGRFLAKANPLTRESVLGKTRAQEFQWLTVSQRGPGLSPERALQDVVKADVKSLQRAQKARMKRK